MRLLLKAMSDLQTAVTKKDYPSNYSSIFF